MTCRLIGLLVIAAASLAPAQLTSEERSGLTDSLTVGNLRLSDLRFERKPFQDIYRLKPIDQALDDPLGAADSLMEWHVSAKTAVLADLLATVRTRGYGETTKEIPAAQKPTFLEASKIPIAIRPIIANLIVSIQACDAEVRTAVSSLTPAERRELIEALPVWAVEEPKVKFSFSKATTVSQARVLSLLAKVDLSRIRNAGVILVRATEKAKAGLLASKAAFAGLVRENIGGLPVEVGGTGPNTFVSTDARLTIDLGGNDEYTGRAGAGVGYCAVQIDLGGNDQYDCQDLSTGAAILGVGVALDNGGHDTFRSRSLAFGAGLAGVGVFEKSGGNDFYSSVALSQGFGLFGVGVLLDTAGDDRYDLKLYGQGASRTQAVGWLVDRSGSDEYKAGGLSLNEPLFTGVYYANAQGFSSGYREDTGGISGGIGLLTDFAGKDAYDAETYGQAASYWFSVGSLYDGVGNDTYSGHHYVQSSAMHCCGAFLFDLAGEDAYVTKVGASLAIGHDYGVALLLDRQGDDLYVARDSTPGVGVANGLGVFIDGGGSDRYDGPPGQGNAARGTGSLGVFVDLGGQDKYRSGLSNGEASYASIWGTSLDSDPPVAAANVVEATPPPQPGSRPKPSDSEMESLYRKATQWGVGSAQAEVAESTRELIAIGVPAFEWMLTNKLAKADRLQQRLFVAVARGIGKGVGGTLGEKALHGSIDEKRNLTSIAAEAGITDMTAVLASYLDVPELRLTATKAAGALKAKAATQKLMELCMSSDRLLVRAAAVSLMQIGDEAAVGTAQALLKSTDLPTRMAAFQLLTAFPTHAQVIAEVMIGDTDEVMARTGMRLYASFGTAVAYNKVAQLLLDPRPGVRIEALQLLKDKCPPEYQATMESLDKDPDELVRAVAKGMKAKR